VSSVPARHKVLVQRGSCPQSEEQKRKALPVSQSKEVSSHSQYPNEEEYIRGPPSTHFFPFPPFGDSNQLPCVLRNFFQRSRREKLTVSLREASLPFSLRFDWCRAPSDLRHMGSFVSQPMNVAAPVLYLFSGIEFPPNFFLGQQPVFLCHCGFTNVV